MGSKEEMKKAVQDSANSQVPAKQGTLSMVKNYLRGDAIKSRFDNILKDKAAGFTQSIVSLVSSSTNFNGVDPNTIIQSALEAATLDLPINPNLGFAYIIPYGRKAQFQMGYKGFVQLALRTGQYATINATEIYEGELVSKNRITGEIVLDETKRTGDKIIGYVSYFRLVNGFEKQLHMTIQELEAHGKKYSKSYESKDKYGNSTSIWKNDPHSMMMKTVIKLLLSKYGILSVQLERALTADQAIITEEGGNIQYNYEDNPDVQEVESQVVEEINWESPESIATAINMLYDESVPRQTILENINAFKKENKKRIEMFSGDDAELINNTFETVEKKALELKK